MLSNLILHLQNMLIQICAKITDYEIYIYINIFHNQCCNIKKLAIFCPVDEVNDSPKTKLSGRPGENRFRAVLLLKNVMTEEKLPSEI